MPAAGASSEPILLALLERCRRDHVAWSTATVWRRVGDRWERVHRHADALVERHDLDELVHLVEALDAERPVPP